MQLQFPVAANSSHGLAGYTIPGTLPALVQPLINMPPPAVPHQLQSVPASYGSITPVQGYQQTATKTLPGYLPTLAQVRQAPDPQQYPLINSTAAAVAGIEPRAPVNDIQRTSIRGESMDILWPDEFVHRSGVSDICFAKLTLPEVVCVTHRDDRYWPVQKICSQSAHDWPDDIGGVISMGQSACSTSWGAVYDTARASPMVDIHQGLERRDATSHRPASHTGQTQSSQRIHWETADLPTVELWQERLFSYGQLSVSPYLRQMCWYVHRQTAGQGQRGAKPESNPDNKWQVNKAYLVTGCQGLAFIHSPDSLNQLRHGRRLTSTRSWYSCMSRWFMLQISILIYSSYLCLPIWTLLIGDKYWCSTKLMILWILQ